MCMIDSSDGWEHLGSATRKARKPYRCEDCPATIEPGEMYYASWGVYEGSIDTYRNCMRCHTAAQWLVEVCRGYLFEGIRDDIEQHWDERDVLGHPLGLGRLVVLARRQWHTRSGELIPVADLERIVWHALPTEQQSRVAMKALAHATGYYSGL